MRKAVILFFLVSFLCGLGMLAFAQFTKEEISEFEKWESFLDSAEVTDQQQMAGREAVTEPWVLTLEKDGVSRKALWKNPEGRMRGFIEGWKWEIAAYRLSRYLGIHMVPPTIERRFKGDRGSCQLWIEDCITLKEKEQEDMKVPSYKVFYWNRALYLQRAFDNLIANEDRHQNQFLITKDWRLILIDHSRSFRTSSKFTKKLIYDEKYKEGPRLMNQLPRDLIEKLKALNFDTVREVVGEYLADDEIEATLVRRDLIIEWVNKRIKEKGEDQVLY